MVWKICRLPVKHKMSSSKRPSLTEKVIKHSSYGENIKLKPTKEYYFILNNGGRSMVVTVKRKRKTIRVFETVAEDGLTRNLKNGQDVIVFEDYTGSSYQKVFSERDIKFYVKNPEAFKDYASSMTFRPLVFCHPKPLFETRYDKLYVSHNITPKDTAKTPKYGLGNSILVKKVSTIKDEKLKKCFRETHYYLIRDLTVSKLSGIKGYVTGFASYLSNGVSYPIIFTSTHLYSWMNEFYEYPLPRDKESKKIMSLLKSAKSPHDLPKRLHKQINDFLSSHY